MSSAVASLVVPFMSPDFPSLAAASPTRHLRVLVAEDEPVARLRLVRTIQRLGHEVFVAADGLEAWELFTQQGADVLITDWLMPIIDGRELCRRVRADQTKPYTYVIFSTVLEGEDNVRDALLAGADDYLIKPTPADDIEARLIMAERVTALHRERAQALAHRDSLLQVARHFATEADPERILSVALSQAMRLLDADAAVLYRWDETDHVLTSVRTTLWSSAVSVLVELGQGAAGRAAAERKPVQIADYEDDTPAAMLFLDAGIHAALAVPLLREGRLFGALEVGRRARKTFSESESDTLELLAANMSSALLALEHTRALQALAETDPLTRLPNRRQGTELLKRCFKLARRRGHHVSLAILDVDNLKEINDLYGHLSGDAVLRGVGELLARAFREDNVVTHWGGDEFVVSLYDVSQEIAMRRLAALQEDLRNTLFTCSDEQSFAVTLSVGVAEYPVHGEDLLELYGAAEAALHEAKIAGRNCIMGATH